MPRRYQGEAKSQCETTMIVLLLQISQTSPLFNLSCVQCQKPQHISFICITPIEFFKNTPEEAHGAVERRVALENGNGQRQYIYMLLCVAMVPREML